MSSGDTTTTTDAAAFESRATKAIDWVPAAPPAARSTGSSSTRTVASRISNVISPQKEGGSPARSAPLSREEIALREEMLHRSLLARRLGVPAFPSGDESAAASSAGKPVESEEEESARAVATEVARVAAEAAEVRAWAKKAAEQRLRRERGYPDDYIIEGTGGGSSLGDKRAAVSGRNLWDFMARKAEKNEQMAAKLAIEEEDQGGRSNGAAEIPTKDYRPISASRTQDTFAKAVELVPEEEMGGKKGVLFLVREGLKRKKSLFAASLVALVLLRAFRALLRRGVL